MTSCRGAGTLLHPRRVEMVRAKVQRPLSVIKRQFGLANNRTQIFKLLDLGHLFMMQPGLMV